MILYELNQAGYASLPKMTKAELEKAKENIITFLDSHDSSYYMMLNHDNKYYTLFTYIDKRDKDKMALEIISVAKSLGELKSIEVNGDILEIWILYNNKCDMYALFNYEKGVIQV